MNCPQCEEELTVEISDDSSRIECLNCGHEGDSFESADEAFAYLEAN